MVEYSDECCGCATDLYPCRGSSCPNRNVPHLICDKCGQEFEELFSDGQEELCLECLLDNYKRITEDDF